MLIGLGPRLRRTWLRVRVRLAHQFALTSYRLSAFARRHAGKLECALWIAAVGIGALLLPVLRPALGSLIDHEGGQAIRGLIGTVGGAMIGGTAITASFILFALQVNVERLPHGLFRHFSGDARLLLSVAASLLLAIAGTALSLVTDDRQIALAILLGLLSLALILRLLFYAYRRSLLLINPAMQLRLLHDGLVRSLGNWSRRVDALAELVELPDDAQPDPPRRESRFDRRRLAVLQASPNWAQGVKAGVSHAAAYARRAGESGDLEVSAFALTGIVSLNDAYLNAKGQTFFAHQLLLDSGHVTDGVVNETLESLKRLHSVALTRKDELQLVQVFNTLAALVQRYGTIDYGSVRDSKSHALLAARYLETAVEAAVPSGLTDTVMQGVQALGRAANNFLAISRPLESVGLTKKIGLIGSVGALKPDLTPVTLVAMEELRDITLNLLRLQDGDPGFAIRQLRDVMSMLTQTFLHTPDKVMGGHTHYLAPYYSGTHAEALQVKLGHIANALAELPADHVAGQKISENLAIWADGLFEPQKALLLLAAEKRSPFFFDIAHWITTVAEVLLVAAAAPAARDHTRGELRKHAHWLVSTLGWLPTDPETAGFAETWSHLDNLVDFALNCRRFDEAECYLTAERIMFDWAIKAGAYHNGWGTLSRWLLALAGLAVSGENGQAGEALKERLAAKLAAGDILSLEMRERAARDLREAAKEIRDQEFETDRVQLLLARGNRAATQSLLIDLADTLSPHTADEPVRRRRIAI